MGILTAMIVMGLIMLMTPKSASQSPAPPAPHGVALKAEVSEVSPKTAEAASPAQSQPQSLPAEKLDVPAELSATEGPLFKSLFSKDPDAQSLVHEVKAGENLTLISRKYGVTVGVIKKINGLDGDKIVPAQKLKIPTYKFSLVVDKSQNTLILKGDEEVLKTYHVSTGEKNSTPVGVFKVTDKLLDPTWYKAGAVVPPGSAENVLGTRWIGISEKGYGIHGTTEPEKIGQQVTAGCVRMRNEEVEELYELVPAGAEVTIVD